MLTTIFDRTKNGFAIMHQALVLMQQHAGFYTFAGLLTLSYAVLIGLLASALLMFAHCTVWEKTVYTADGLTCYQGTFHPWAWSTFMLLLLCSLFIHTLWKALLEVAVSLYTQEATAESGRAASTGQALRDGCRLLWQLCCWVLFNLTVGTLISIISGRGEQRSPSFLAALRALFGNLVAMAWSACTFLVLQVIAFEHTGAIESVKASFSLMKKSFGESLAASFAFSLFYSAVAGLLLIALKLLVLLALPGLVTLAVLVMLVLLASFATSVITVARMAFKTCIYFYTKQHAFVGFEPTLLQQSFR